MQYRHSSATADNTDTAMSATSDAPGGASARPAASGARISTVLHVITGLETGGAETMLLRLVRRMDQEAFRSVVVTFMEGGALRPSIIEAGAPVHSVRMRQGRPSLPGLARLVRIVREVQPDLIQGWMYHGNLAASVGAALARTRVPVAWNVRASLSEWPSHGRLTRGVIRLGAVMSSGASALVYNANRTACEHEALGYSDARRVVIPNGFDCSVLKPDRDAGARLRAEIGLPADAPVIGMVARFDPVKDHATFLNGAARLSARDASVHFVLAGRGITAENAEIASIVARSGLGTRVHLLGERPDIAAVNNVFDIATSSSWSEAFPNVLGEAMACGVPCVATDVGDSAVILGDTGILVPPRDPEALAAGWASILALGREGRASLGEQARRRLLERFSIETVTQQYESLYTGLLNQRMR